MLLKINYILFILFPWALISGPFLADLIASTCALIIIIYIWKNYSNNILKDSFVLISLIFYFYILLRSIFSVDILLSLESSLFYFRFIFFSISIFFILKNLTPKWYKYILFSFFLSSSVVSLDVIYQYFNSNNSNLIGFVSEKNNRFSGLFNDEYILGSYLTRISPFVIFLIFNFKFYKIHNLYAYLLILISFYAVFISGERAALILYTFVIITSFLILKVSFLKKIIFFLMIFGILFFSFQFSDVHYKRLIVHTQKQLNIVKHYPDDIGFIPNKYFSFFITSKKMFLDNIIFGQGPKTYRLLCSNNKFNYPNSCSTHPHNTYLQILSETGLIGFSFIFIFTLIIIKNYIFALFQKKRNFDVFIFLGCLFFIQPFLPSGQFFNNWINSLFSIYIGSYLYIKNLNKEYIYNK